VVSEAEKTVFKRFLGFRIFDNLFFKLFSFFQLLV